MEDNNFKRLYEDEENAYEVKHHQKIRANVLGTLGLFRLVGDLVDVFLPRVMDIFVMASGGRDDGPGPVRSRKAPPTDPRRPNPGENTPKGPNEVIEE